MPRHSKHNYAGSVFTRHEREEAGYGTKRRRLGTDSLKLIDSCAICLHPLKDPRVCPEGHLFCNECIVGWLVRQKQDSIRAKAQLAAASHDAAEHALDERAAAKQAEIAEFEKAQSSLTPATGGSSGRATKEQPKRKRAQRAGDVDAPYDDEEFVGGVRDDGATPQGTAAAAVPAADYEGTGVGSGPTLGIEVHDPNLPADRQLPAYWAMSKLPEVHKPATAAAAQAVASTATTKCPEGSHPLKLKDLVAVKFSVSAESKVRDPNAVHSAGYECPVCLKPVSNNMKLAILKKCGHAVCAPCLDSVLIKDKQCYVCEARFKTKHIIRSSASTGFAGSGGAELEAKQIQPGLIC